MSPTSKLQTLLRDAENNVTVAEQSLGKNPTSTKAKQRLKILTERRDGLRRELEGMKTLVEN